MEIDVKQAGEVGFLVLFTLLFAMILNIFYPNDFSIFSSDLLISPIKFDAVTIGGWTTIIIAGGAVGFFTSGNSLAVAITGLILGLCVFIYPVFVYMIDVFTLGMFSYPNYEIHQDTPILMLLLIAIPASAVTFYLVFDLITSALHSAIGGD
ncbi:unnamed protein product [marine sediment metagenome]|uniref:Uncharacterized protein n=1 Tax=marine sediment metagenome TaxID=412755 RepID=X0ZAJ8_9ZZZZ